MAADLFIELLLHLLLRNRLCISPAAHGHRILEAGLQNAPPCSYLGKSSQKLIVLPKGLKKKRTRDTRGDATSPNI
jgi:hypothetical protein